MTEVPAAISYLLIEDNRDHALIIQNTIRRLNNHHRVSHIDDGEKAIDYLKTSETADLPNIILLDIKMPKKDGFEVLDFIRNHERLKHIPVIMLSTSSQKFEVMRAYKKGANTYLSKPVRFNDFVNVIDNLNLYWSETAIMP